MAQIQRKTSEAQMPRNWWERSVGGKGARMKKEGARTKDKGSRMNRDGRKIDREWRRIRREWRRMNHERTLANGYCSTFNFSFLIFHSPRYRVQKKKGAHEAHPSLRLFV